MANNTANAGAGTEIAGATGYTSIVGISNTVISGNSAVLQGAAFNLGSTNGTTFTNVTFLNNVGECTPLNSSVLCLAHQQNAGIRAIPTDLGQHSLTSKGFLPEADNAFLPDR